MFLPRTCTPVWSRFAACASVSSLPSSMVSKSMLPTLATRTLKPKPRKKVYIIGGPGFGELEGHTLVIHKALYGLRSSGLRWHKRFADTLRDMGHDWTTGRAVTGTLHFLNGTPIDGFSKQQNTVETATYGSELVASIIATDQVIDLQLTLQYLGVG